MAHLKRISLLLVFLVLSFGGCNTHPQALVHLYFDKDLSLVSESFVSGPGLASIYLSEGIHVIRFKRRGEVVGCILNVDSGGEVYLTIDIDDLAPIIRAEESE